MLKNFDGVQTGTQLEVRGDLTVDEFYENIYVTHSMSQLRGQIVTVKLVEPCNCVIVYGNMCHWSPSMFVRIVDDISLFDMLSGGEVDA